MKRNLKTLLTVSFSVAAVAALGLGLGGCGEQEEPPVNDAHEHVYEWVDASFATCTKKGVKKQICSVCGAEGESRETDLVPHTPGAVQSSGETHSYTCTVCGNTFGDEAHSYVWETVTPATHTTRGSEKEVCSVCKAESGQTRETDYAHTPGEWQIEGDEHWRVCTGCDAVLDKGLHDYGTGKTCLACGSEDYHTEDPGFFTYEETEGGVIINDYLGRDVEDIRFPAMLDGKKVIGIGERLFYRDKTIKSVYIPDGVETIGNASFAYCENLSSLRLPATLKTIESYAFTETPIHSELYLPEGLRSIGEAAFAKTNIEHVRLPESLTEIGDKQFYQCKQLKSIIFNDAIERIDGGSSLPGNMIDMFNSCESLEWVVFGKGIRTIESNAFAKCNAITHILFNGTPEEFMSVTIKMSTGSNGQGTLLTVPVYYNDGTQNPGSWWYDAQGEVQYNEWPASDYVFTHTNINGGWTLDSYTGAQTARLTLPAEYCGLPVTIVGDYAFSGKKYLHQVTIPESYRFIGTRAFANSGLTSIYIPDSVSDRYEGVAYSVAPFVYKEVFYGCESLTKVTGMKNFTRFVNGMFEGCPLLCHVDVPNGLEYIGDLCFYNDVSLESITLPDSLTAINSSAFNGCSGLQKIALPDSVDFLMQDKKEFPRVFQGCTSLKTVVLPKTITLFPNEMFSGCTSIETFVFPASVKFWGSKIFNNATIQNVYYYGDETQWQELIDAAGGTSFSGTAESKFMASATVYYYSEYYKEGAWHFTSADHTTVALWAKDEDPDAFFTFADAEGGYKVTAYSGDKDLVVIPAEHNSKPVVALGDELFRGKTAIKRVVLPDSIVSIGKYAFSGTSIERFDLPETITSVGEGLFRECAELYMVTGCAGLKELPKEMFYGCANLIGFTVPESVTALGSDLFNGCSRLTEFTVPANVKGTLSRLFVNCTALKTVQIVGENATLGAQNFSGCTALEWAAIPAVSKFEANTFEGWNASAKLYYGGSETQWKAIDGLANAPAEAEVHYFSADELNGSWHWNGTHTQPIFWGQGTTRHLKVTLMYSGLDAQEFDINSQDSIVVTFVYEVKVEPTSTSWPGVMVKAEVNGVETEYDYYYASTFLLITGKYYSPCGSFGKWTNDPGRGGKLWLDPAGTHKGMQYTFSCYFNGNGLLTKISID